MNDNLPMAAGATVPAELTVMSKGIPSDHEMMVYQTMAEQVVSSKMYKGIGDKAGVMMIMLAARELGIPPMQSLNGGLNIISGKVEISARMMNALIRRAGHQIHVKECTDNMCTLVGKRHDTGESQTSSFSVAEAQRAGLIKQGGGWTKFPKDMCFARALSRLSRQLFSDVIGIGYVEGEIRPSYTESVEMPAPEHTFMETAEYIDNDEENLEKLINMFDKEDQSLILEYMKIVIKHFGWSQAECVKKFIDEKDLHDKFNKWKIKRKTT